MKVDEIIKALKCCCSSPKADRCKNECIFYRNDLDMSKCIGSMGKVAADLLERLQTENKAITKDRDQWRVAAEASRDVIQPKLRAEIKQLKAKLKQLEYGYNLQDTVIKRLENSNKRLSDRVVNAECLMRDETVKESWGMSEIKKAIELLQWVLNDCTHRVLSDGSATKVYSLAIQALQEKAEREIGCRWCSPKHPEFEENCVNVDIWDSRKVYTEWKDTVPNFCPMCGRKAVEE